jgi:hypothetical protein
MTLEELEKRVRVLEDLEEIKKVHREYVFALASLQWADYVNCFTDDAVLDIWTRGTRRGKKEIIELINSSLVKDVKPVFGHLASQPVITIDGDTAKGYWILYLFFPRTEKKTWVQGRQDCEYRKVDGKWKISYVKFVRPWPPKDTPSIPLDV